MNNAEFNVRTVISSMFAENAYVLHLRDRQECLVFDPGFDADQIIREIREDNLSVAAIVNTHGHADHIAGNAALKQQWPSAPIVIGKDDSTSLLNPEENLSAQFGFPITSPPADRLLVEGDVFTAAGFSFDIYETPGHSAGHIIFVWKAITPWIVMGGDVLFQGSVGRTDFPGCNADTLLNSIHSKLFNLPDDTIVLPGHGESTTIGEEKRTNPFVGAPAGYTFN
ncbi:MAG: MBL fold metallo-hydrolase [Pirellulaceae bacterium]|nr:MBL fold metallo-hydrolase [Pirellulaceae bacterium]